MKLLMMLKMVTSLKMMYKSYMLQLFQLMMMEITQILMTRKILIMNTCQQNPSFSILLTLDIWHFKNDETESFMKDIAVLP